MELATLKAMENIVHVPTETKGFLCGLARTPGDKQNGTWEPWNLEDINCPQCLALTPAITRERLGAMLATLG